MKFKLGADPEVFLYDTSKNEIVSVEGMIKTEDGKGTKNFPLIVEGGFSLQEDNVLAEFNIPPAKTQSEWVSHLNFALDALNVVIPDDIVYKIQASAELKDKYLQTEQAMTIGCESDYNAWTLDENEREFTSNLRVAGGHIHVGFEDKKLIFDEEFIINRIKAMDLFLGVPSLFLDEDSKRREVYGNAGSFRYKSYGFEYRTLSNFWLRSEELMRWAWEQTETALNFKGNVSELVQVAIDTNNKDLATELCGQYNINIPIQKILK